METGTYLQIAWFLIIGFLLAGYAVLDGFDLGIGALLPMLARNEEETRSLIRAIGPVWDGNEVWLVAGGAALFAAFPRVYATVFSGFYIAFMLLLFALMFRAVSFEFWSNGGAHRGAWIIALAAGSFIPTLLFGVALGNVVQGIPMNVEGDFTGSFLTLLRPLPLAFGALGCIAILTQGMTWAALKVAGDAGRRARRWAAILWYPYTAILPVTVMVGLVTLPAERMNIAAWGFLLLVVAFLALLRYSLRWESEYPAFLFSTGAFLGLWGIAASLQFPLLVRSATDPALSLTIRNAASDPLALRAMLIVALIGLPVVVGYTVAVYRIFKGKIGGV